MIGIMDRHKLDVVAAGGKNTAKVQKAICSGFFRLVLKGHREILSEKCLFLS